MPFKKGKGGRPKGAKNLKTPEVSDWCRQLVENETYRVNLAARLHEGKVAPAVEAMVWAYAFGKPKERVEHSGEVNLPTRVVHEYRTH